MKKIVIALVMPVVLLVGSVFIAPSFIDWNSYKDQVVGLIRDNTGRDAGIDGDITFSIFPTPTLSVTGLRVANFEGAQTVNMMRLRELRVRVSIGALLERRVVVEQLELVEPVIALEVAEDGKASWDIDIADVSESVAESAESKAGETLFDITLENVRVNGGAIRFEDRRAGMFERVTDLQMTIVAQSLSGPFDMRATARARGVPVSVELKTGKLSPKQPLTIGLKAVLTEADAQLRFNGKIFPSIPNKLLSGKLEIVGSNAAKLALAVGKGDLPLVLAQPVSVSGMLTVSADTVVLNDSAIKFGPVSGNGAISVLLGEPMDVDIAMSVGRLNLDELFNRGTGMTRTPAEPVPPPAASAEPKTSKSDLAQLEVPKNLNASFDLAIDVIQYRGELIREAGLRAALANGEVTLDRASALLPGASDISLLGFLSFIEGEPRFDGEISAASGNLRSLLDWTGVDTSAFPPDRLRGFSYSSKLNLTPAALEVQDINVRLDTSTMTGGLAVALRERLGFGLRLAIDQLNMDAYQARPLRKQAASGPNPKSPQIAVPPSLPKSSLEALGYFDANIDLEIERLIIQKTLVHKVRFDGGLVGGNLNVRKASVADFSGARIDVSGDVKGLAGIVSVGLKYQAMVNDPGKLFRFLSGSPAPISLRQLGKPNFTGRVDGTLEALALKSDIAVAGIKIVLKGKIKQIISGPVFNLGVAIKHPELAQFVRLAAPNFRSVATKLGPLAAAFRLSGTLQDFKLSALDAMAGPVQVRGAMEVRADEDAPYLKVDLTTSEILLDLFRPPMKPGQSATARGRPANIAAGAGGSTRSNGRWSRELIDLAGLQALDADVTLRMAGLISDKIRLSQPVVDAQLKSGQLDVKQFHAGILGGTVSVKARLNYKPNKPSMSIDWVLSNIALEVAAKTFGVPPRASGLVSANASLTMSGNSEVALVSSLTGTGKFSGRVQVNVTEQENRTIGAFGLVSGLFGNKIKELRQVGGVTDDIFNAFGRSKADLVGTVVIDRGVIKTRDTALNGNGAKALTTGAISLPSWLIHTTTSVVRTDQQKHDPLFSVVLTGPLDSPNPKLGGGFLRSSKPSLPTDPIRQILPGILAPKPASGSGSGKVEPKDILRGLLKGLGG